MWPSNKNILLFVGVSVIMNHHAVIFSNIIIPLYFEIIWEILRKFELVAVHDHQRSLILMPIESVYETSN